MGGANPDALIAGYGSLVKRIARQLVRRMPAHVEVADLIQSGVMGLLEAAQRFDSLKNPSFASFAVPRIRGSMLDQSRLSDWGPRSLRRRHRALERARIEIEVKTGEIAGAAAIAQSAGVSLKAFYRVKRDVFLATHLSLDALVSAGTSWDCTEPKDAQSGLSEQLEREELSRCLTRAIDALPDAERTMFLLYYNEELLMREIGTILEVSESRVCQIHRRVLAKLRKAVLAA